MGIKKFNRRISAPQIMSGFGGIREQTWASPAADSTKNMFSIATLGTSAAVTITAGQITDPDFARTICVYATGSTTHISATQPIIAGTDIDGNSISDTITAFTLNTTSTVYSTKAFKTITSVVIPKQSKDGVQIGIGGGPSLGLDRKCKGGVQAIVGAWKGNSGESTASAAASAGNDVSKCVVNFNTSYDGASTYGVWYVTDDLR